MKIFKTFWLPMFYPKRTFYFFKTGYYIICPLRNWIPEIQGISKWLFYESLRAIGYVKLTSIVRDLPKYFKVLTSQSQILPYISETGLYK